MNIQNLKENELVKKALPILKILDFRKYFFAYLFIAFAAYFVYWELIDSYTLINAYIEYMIMFFIIVICIYITPFCLIAEIILRTLLKKFYPNNQILINLENLPKKITKQWSVIFYVLFSASFLIYIFFFWIIITILYFKYK